MSTLNRLCTDMLRSTTVKTCHPSIDCILVCKDLRLLRHVTPQSLGYIKIEKIDSNNLMIIINYCYDNPT